ncbi:19147_t:CDS:2, partial [Gigaspora rosea]
MLGDLCGKRRKNENKNISALRVILIIILLLCLVTYIIILIIDVCNDVPIIIQSIEGVSSLPIPDLIFTSTGSYNISCLFQTNNGTKSCDEYVTPPTLLEINNKFTGFFSSNESFKNFESLSPNDISSVTIIVRNPNNLTIFAMILDHETDIYSINGKLNALSYSENFNMPDPLNNLVSGIFIDIINLQAQHIRLIRNVREKILPQRFRDLIGITPDFIKYYYITINSQTLVNLQYVSSSRLLITPQNFNLNKETEHRNKTLLGVIGLAGGAWGLVLAIYTFLF